LALYDGAIERMAMALSLLRDDQRESAIGHLCRAQLIVAELAAGVIPEVNPDVNIPLLRLFEFVANQLVTPTIDSVSSAVRVLMTLREGYQAIRAEALELERTGQIPPSPVASVSSLA
jgi:flagellar protein FliS